MSLVKTLAKVALGVAVAKGVSSVMKGGGTGGIAGMMRGTGGGGPLGEMLASLGESMKGGPESATRGLQDVMGRIQARSMEAGQAAMGSMGDMMNQMTRGLQSGGTGATPPGLPPTPTLPKGGLGNVLSQMTSGGGLGTLLGASGAAAGAGGLGALLGGALLADPTPPEPTDEALALVMLRAILQAAKCDGRLDDAEQARIEQMVGGLSDEESALIRAELQSPVDVPGLAEVVPAGMEEQAYMMSLIAIDLDSQPEADYLISLAGALGLTPAQVDALHTQAGEPKIT